MGGFLCFLLANTASQVGSNVHCTHVLFRDSVGTYTPLELEAHAYPAGPVHLVLLTCFKLKMHTILSRATALAILSSKDGLKALERNQKPTPQQLLGNKDQNLTPLQQLLSRNLNFTTLQLSSKRDKNPTPLQLLIKEMPGEAFIDQQETKET